jgi:hypothetical protein
MVKSVFYAQDGTVTVGGTDFTTDVTEISITGGARDVEAVRTFGSGSNHYLFEKGQELMECSLTTVKKDHQLAQYLLGGSDGSMPYSITGDQPRFAVDKAIIYTWTDRYDTAGAQLRITMASVFSISKEMSNAVDGYLSETISYKCLPKDYTEEYTQYQTGSALP